MESTGEKSYKIWNVKQIEIEIKIEIELEMKEETEMLTFQSRT